MLSGRGVACALLAGSACFGVEASDELPVQCQPAPGRRVEEFFNATSDFLYMGEPFKAEQCIRQWKQLFPLDTRPLYMQLTAVARMPAWRDGPGSAGQVAADLREAELLLNRLLDDVEDAEGFISQHVASVLVPLYYGMAYGHRQLKDLDTAWAYILAGNRLKFGTLSEQDLSINKLKISMMQLWTPVLQVQDMWATMASVFAQHVPSPSFGEELVFIIGLPRTGSTLLEFLLSRHPSIRATGEAGLQPSGGSILFQDVWLKLAQELTHEVEAGSLSLTKMLAVFTQEQRQALMSEAIALVKSAQQLLKESADPGGKSSFQLVTDKLLPNSMVAPLIRWLLPGARILMCTRAPVDSAISSFWQLFEGTFFVHTYDFDSLGGHVWSHTQMELAFLGHAGITEKLMQVSYENMAYHSRATMEEVLSFLGLPWNDSVLDGNAASSLHMVRTASVTQVRGPMYQTGVGRWRDEARYFRPLLRYLPLDERRPAETGDSAAPVCRSSSASAQGCDRKVEL